MLATLRAKLQEMDIQMEFAPEAVEAVAEKGYDPTYGARPLRRVIQSQIEDDVSERMLEGSITAGKRVPLHLRRRQILLRGSHRLIPHIP